MIFVNLHNLPSGKSLYTLLIHNGRGMYDEVDVVASSWATPVEICREGRDDLEMYSGQRVVAIANQSSGVPKDLKEGLLIGEDGTV